jgi:hypothetical protein
VACLYILILKYASKTDVIISNIRDIITSINGTKVIEYLTNIAIGEVNGIKDDIVSKEELGVFILIIDIINDVININ